MSKAQSERVKRILRKALVLCILLAILPGTAVGIGGATEVEPGVSADTIIASQDPLYYEVSGEAWEASEDNTTINDETASSEDALEGEVVQSEDDELAQIEEEDSEALAELTEVSEETGEYTATIDLSARSDSVTGTGYTVTGGSALAYNSTYIETAPKGTLTFNNEAYGRTYQVIQSGIPSNPNIKGLKYGSSMVLNITVQTGVEMTLVISDIHLIGSIYLEGTAKVTLLLDNTSYIRGSVFVPSSSALTIDSLNGNDAYDRLLMPTDLTGSNQARIGSEGGMDSLAGNTAGRITINGGSIDITAHSTGAGIGGGGRSAHSIPTGGTGGTITINGGSVSVSQYGSNSIWGTGPSGACIGGGGSPDDGFGGGAGYVLITGGTVKVRQYTRAAGIGGGNYGPAGDIVIEGGVVDVEVIRLVEQSGAGEGAGIGNAAGTNAGTGSITISGGSVRSVAYMTGIGRVHSSDSGPALPITITGGTVYAKGSYGPGIGHWSNSLGGSITITGGVVVAESDHNTAIGRSGDGDTVFYLGTDADVRASSGGGAPAINVADNRGDGYFVNASFAGALSTTVDIQLNVYAGGAGFFKTVTMPRGYKHFAYSSELASSRIDTIMAYRNAEFIGTVLRVKDSSMQIYSVKTRIGYSAHNTSEICSLPVKLGTASVQCLITEKYVDVDGNAIPGHPDTQTLLTSPDLTYTKDPIPSIDGYEVLGYFVGSTYAPLTVPNQVYFAAKGITGFSVSADTTVFFIYQVSTTTVTVTKQVSGLYANKRTEFSFSLMVEDSTHTALARQVVAYSISEEGVSGVVDGSLTLDERGMGTFTLRHGQSITFKDLPAHGYVQVVEEYDSSYEASFIDSEFITSTPVNAGNDTTLLALTQEARTFDFTNTRITEIESGVLENIDSALLPLTIIAVTVALLGAMLYLRKRVA